MWKDTEWNSFNKDIGGADSWKKPSSLETFEN